MPFDQQTYKEISPSSEEISPSSVPYHLTLEAFRDWLKTQCALGRADEPYCWMNDGNCLFAQYARYLGLSYSTKLSPYTKLMHEYMAAGALHCGEPWRIAIDPPWTFGAALERADEELARSAAQGALTSEDRAAG